MKTWLVAALLLGVPLASGGGLISEVNDLLGRADDALPEELGAPSIEIEGPGAYVVGLHALERDVAAGDRYHGDPITWVNHAIKFLVVDVDDPESFRRAVEEDAQVRYVLRDALDFHASYVPSETYYGCCQWGIQDVGVETAWDTTLGSTSVTLAILDSGLRKSHEDIGNYLQGYDFVYNDNNPNDANGHGTHVTSTAAGLTDNGLGVAGVAQATVLPVRVLNGAGSGTHSQIANGVTYAADQGADILSMSLGGPGSQTILDAINYADASGALIIAATGNDNGPVGYPAAYSNVVAVGAYDQNQNRASFSNYGSQMEISAPGVQIAAAYNRNDSDYVYQDGTSMATPIVSGAAALALTVDPTLTSSELRQMLRDTARDFGASGWDQYFGYGAVDAAALVASAASGGGGGGGGGPVTVYEDDFEGTTSFVKSSGSSDLWRLSSGCLGGNPTTSLQFNEASDCQYSTGAQTTGWSRVEVDLSGASSATWSFDHRWETESYGGGAYDIMRVQISGDNASWTTLEQWDSRDANQASWTGASYDISSWAGDSTVWLRYFFDSVDGSYNNYDGWAVDNVLVTKS
ncbi:MAG: S8 family serine peptidase [Thermoplasmatota archaeon]